MEASRRLYETWNPRDSLIRPNNWQVLTSFDGQATLGWMFCSGTGTHIKVFTLPGTEVHFSVNPCIFLGSPKIARCTHDIWHTWSTACRFEAVFSKRDALLRSSREGSPIFAHGHSFESTNYYSYYSKRLKAGRLVILLWRQRQARANILGNTWEECSLGQKEFRNYSEWFKLIDSLESVNGAYWPEIKRDTSLNSPKSRTIRRYCSVSEQGQYGHGPTVAANHAYQKKVSVRFWRTTRSCWRCLQLFCSNTLKGLVDTWK